MNGIYGRINSNQSIFLLYPKKGLVFTTFSLMTKWLKWYLDGMSKGRKNWSHQVHLNDDFEVQNLSKINKFPRVNEIVDIFPNLQNNWLWYLSCWFHHFLLTFQARIFCWKNQLITFCFYAFISLHSVRVSALFGHEKNGTKRAERFVNRRGRY